MHSYAGLVIVSSIGANQFRMKTSQDEKAEKNIAKDHFARCISFRLDKTSSILCVLPGLVPLGHWLAS